MKVITRFPPSPTGFFHIGGARTALYNFMFARHNGGVMYLRFEDTDTARSSRDFEKDIVDGLSWLGIEYVMPEVFRQSERTDIYRTYLKKLIDAGAAYVAEPATDDPSKNIIRFKNPNVKVTFHDLVRGEVTFDTTELKDFIIAKDSEHPLYHLAVVIDDHDMAITHVIRGEDHISNTPRQILMLEALGFERPHYAHIPLILAPDRSKMSKRHGATSVNEYRAQGYLPGALVNYLALLGWNPGGEREIYDVTELARLFDIEKVQKGGAIFDIERLKAYNREYLKGMTDAAFYDWASGPLKTALAARGFTVDERELREKICPLIRERISVWADITKSVEAGELDFIFTEPKLDAKKIPEKKSTTEQTIAHLQHARDTLADLTDFSETAIKDALWNYATENGRGAVLWPLRYALTGREKSPDPFVVASIVGKETTLRRIDAALQQL